MDRPRQLETLPDFLGIGAQRAGTTWLHHNLQRHPHVWMPPLKELHYFDRAIHYPSPSSLAEESLIVRALGKGDPSEQWRRKLKGNLKRRMGEISLRDAPWYLRFFLGRYNDRWYASLFARAKNKIKGEITPSYSILEPRDIEHISRMMPEAKIIFVLRNPIDRTWSAIRYSKRRLQHQLESMSFEGFKSIVNKDWVALRANYVRTIENWGSYFPKEQFFIGFFEDIMHRPNQFLTQVFEFLGVDPSEENVTSLAARTINPSPHKEIRPEFKQYLAEVYYPQIKALSEMLGGYASQWRRQVEETLQSQPYRP